jgi:hypothetical protein
VEPIVRIAAVLQRMLAKETAIGEKQLGGATAGNGQR